ncbi:MAG: Rpn family recombination-promoting nuclease/putative transposase [Okeania sp. SIO3B5]|uniref:Rpn family recombination-promoting nuclease/putative transposase n=1 Tax=Okeania sp. SIO3B5 TaxID=2607811 RepID=UPI0014017B6B|nr:Rpn family recombination-promoting nuclease/putative transposase [Okeania sp. SIO3B5]NEO56341.1 Rpn family recombination-promoting nuclease/putative transposase [Okeania sp. SIO3B5]
MKTDSIFYRLFLEIPGVYFQLIGKSPTLANSYKFRSVEIKQTAFRLDGVLVPNIQSPDTPIHFAEVQMQKDEAFYRRFFGEIFLYLSQYEEAKYWQALVVFRNRNIEPKDTQPYQALLNSSNVTVVYLEDLGEEAYDNLGLGIVKLIVEDEAKAVQQAKMLSAKATTELAQEAEQQKVLELVKTVILYKFQNLGPEEVIEMLGMEDFKKSRLYQGIKQEGREEGRQEGTLLTKLRVVPMFLELGLTIEEIAQRLDLTVEQVQQASQSQSN